VRNTLTYPRDNAVWRWAVSGGASNNRATRFAESNGESTNFVHWRGGVEYPCLVSSTKWSCRGVGSYVYYEKDPNRAQTRGHMFRHAGSGKLVIVQKSRNSRRLRVSRDSWLRAKLNIVLELNTNTQGSTQRLLVSLQLLRSAWAVMCLDCYGLLRSLKFQLKFERFFFLKKKTPYEGCAEIKLVGTRETNWKKSQK